MSLTSAGESILLNFKGANTTVGTLEKNTIITFAVSICGKISCLVLLVNDVVVSTLSTCYGGHPHGPTLSSCLAHAYASRRMLAHVSACVYITDAS